MRDKFNRCNGVAFQDSSSNGTAKSASTFASVSRFSTMSQRIKSNNEAGAAAAAGDAATGRKGSQSSTVRENTEFNSSQISILHSTYVCSLFLDQNAQTRKVGRYLGQQMSTYMKSH